MKGKVVEINQARGMAAVLTEEGEYSIIEMIGDEVAIGDKLIWTGNYPMGAETVSNESQRRSMRVCFQNHWVQKSNVRQQLLY